MTKDDIIRMAREATEHLSDVDSVRLQGIVLLALDAGAAHKAEVALAERDVLLRQIRHWALTNLNTDLVAYIDAIRVRKTT